MDRSVPAEEIARLTAMRRLALGAAHGLNNAFTAVIGEAGFLREDCKEDPRVVEACDAMLSSMERCARITRALLVRRQPNQSGGDTELIRTVRELAALLDETLGSRNALTVRMPDDILPVEGDASQIELVLLTYVHYAADHPAPGSGRQLALTVQDGDGQARLELDVTVPELGDEVIAAATDPSQASDALTRACLEAALTIIRSLGGDVQAARTAPDGWRLGIRLPVSSQP